MSVPHLTLVLLLAGCFGLAAKIGPRFEQMGSRRSGGFLSGLFGESRKLFASHFFTRSDVYFHSGYYPSIFDRKSSKPGNHLAETAGAEKKSNPAHGEPGHVHHEGEEEHEEEGHVHGEHCQHGEEHDFLGKPRDPMDAFSRNFFVSKHTHLSDKGTNAPREILPWIQLAAKLDPEKVESYTVGAYWLRELHKDDEAEQFLREGLRRNPESYEIMLELGRGYVTKRDLIRARNVLEMAMQRWREQENSKPAEEQNRLSAQQILNYLALVEDQAGNRERAISWLTIVKKLSPHPEEIDKRIAEIQAGQPFKAN